MRIGALEKPFTYQYSQPGEYRFSLDSIELPWLVAPRYMGREDLAELRVLDLCAGSGVVGFELAFTCPALRYLDFCEVQSIYAEHFRRNLAITGAAAKDFRFLNVNFEALLVPELAARYDLILCNPPYFDLGTGVLPASEFKRRCRYHVDSSAARMLEVILHTLKPTGEAFVLTRAPGQLTNPQRATEIFAMVRTTPLVRLRPQDGQLRTSAAR